MALTLAGYLHREINMSTEYVPMKVSRLEILKPLVALPRGVKGQQVVRIASHADSCYGGATSQARLHQI